MGQHGYFGGLRYILFIIIPKSELRFQSVNRLYVVIVNQLKTIAR
jgi:hypothetical protein